MPLVYTLAMIIDTPARLKIGINGRFLQHPYTGIGQYTMQLLREFSKMKHDNTDEVRHDDSLRHVDFIIAVPNQKCIEQMRREKIDLPVAIIPEKQWLAKSLAKHWWEQIQVSDFFHEQKVNLIWLPYACTKWFGGNDKTRTKTIVTVHDTIPWTLPEYQRGLLSRLAHAMSRRSVAHADHIITVSKASANDISQTCDIAKEHIAVIKNGVSEIFHQPVSQNIIDETLKQYNLSPKQFFLYVGGYDARKNVRRMVESYKKYSEIYARHKKHTYPYPLVLVGGKSHEDALYADYDTITSVKPEADMLTENKNSRTVSIVTTGFLEDINLAALYQSSRGFVHFSSAEGFNIPLAQAMISHLPLLISDTTIHREIAGNSATYIQLDDDVTMMNGWDRLTNADTRNDHPNSNDSNAHQFSWERSAKDHLCIFNSIAARTTRKSIAP